MILNSEQLSYIGMKYLEGHDFLEESGSNSGWLPYVCLAIMIVVAILVTKNYVSDKKKG